MLLLIKYLLRYFKYIRTLVVTFGLDFLKQILPKPLYITLTLLYPIFKIAYQYAKGIYAFIGLVFTFALIDHFNILEPEALIILFWMTWEIMKSFGFRIIDRILGTDWSFDTKEIKVSVKDPKVKGTYHKDISDPFNNMRSKTFGHSYEFTPFNTEHNDYLSDNYLASNYQNNTNNSWTWKTYLYYTTIAVLVIGTGWILYNNTDVILSYIYDATNSTHGSNGGRGGHLGGGSTGSPGTPGASGNQMGSASHSSDSISLLDNQLSFW